MILWTVGGHDKHVWAYLLKYFASRGHAGRPEHKDVRHWIVYDRGQFHVNRNVKFNTKYVKYGDLVW